MKIARWFSKQKALLLASIAFAIELFFVVGVLVLVGYIFNLFVSVLSLMD